MKIAFIGGFAFSPKGTVRARAHPLAAELVRLGHEVTIFLPPYDNLADCGRDWKAEGVRIRNVGRTGDQSSGKFVRPVVYARILAQLICEVKGYRPDLIHVFKPKGFAGAAATYFVLRGDPLVVLDCDDWEGWGGWNEIKNHPRMVKEYIDWQERWLMRKASSVTVASRALEVRAANLRRDQEGVFYIPNCGASSANRVLQDAVRTRPREEAKAEFGFDDHPVVLYSGHFEDAESVAFFCRSVARAAARHQAHVVFVGDDAHEGVIRRYFPNAAENRLRFFPRLNYEHFLRLIWASDVAAFPYPDDRVHWAKCSARITDYMAMGRAVLTSAVGQNLEYIVDGESGLLARPGGENDFAGKLESLLSDPELRLALGAQASYRVQAKFAWSEQARHCLAAYDYALTRTRHRLSPVVPPESSSHRTRSAA